VKSSALANSVLGAGISGVGPSIFALCKRQNIADQVTVSRSDTYLDTRISFAIPISKINDRGVKIL
jgi:homoserine kinase